MYFAWPDPVSLIADIVTIIGVPVLAVSTWKLYRTVREARKPKGVGEDCINFYDVAARCGINLVPIRNITAIPRTGDVVSLPGETDDERNDGGGRYEVVGVEFYYREDREPDRPTAATPLAIHINVKRLVDFSG